VCARPAFWRQRRAGRGGVTLTSGGGGRPGPVQTRHRSPAGGPCREWSGGGRGRAKAAFVHFLMAAVCPAPGWPAPRLPAPYPALPAGTDPGAAAHRAVPPGILLAIPPSPCNAALPWPHLAPPGRSGAGWQREVFWKRFSSCRGEFSAGGPDSHFPLRADPCSPEHKPRAESVRQPELFLSALLKVLLLVCEQRGTGRIC